jgi:hypothetical protein
LAERDRAIATLVSAFEDDPVERWMYPRDQQYRLHFPAFVAAFGGAAFDDQSVWCLRDRDAARSGLPPAADQMARR